MAQEEYHDFLAANVLNEQQIVSYRTLSRALKVHSNVAKHMLFDFHRKQNARKPGSVHATYLLAGTTRLPPPPHANGVHSAHGQDTVMQSSPPLPSSSAAQADDTPEEYTSVTSLLLAREEHLEQARKTFDSLTSIHIYTLQANGLSDVQALTECNRKIAATYTSEDPLRAWKQYGTIQNAHVKRRTVRGAPPPAPPIAKDAEAKTEPFATTAKAKEAQMKAETKEPPSKPAAEAGIKGLPKPAHVKRQNSDIFKSFAKTRTKAAAESQSSAEATPIAEPEDEPMTGFSDDDMSDEVPAEKGNAPGGKSKEEREAELQAMMDQEDEPMEDAATPASHDPDEQKAAIDKPDAQEAPGPQETVIIENGRRRGKRRIMKKRTVKDEEGYLVTKEEAAWESFSEDEPQPKKLKVPPTATLNAGNKPAAKKVGKPGQGNIMSFFSKK